jgi:hypothetical protein
MPPNCEGRWALTVIASRDPINDEASQEAPPLHNSRRSLNATSPASLKKAIDPQALNQKRVDDLVDREPEIAVALEACAPNAPCSLLICAEYTEKARAPYIAELSRIEGLYQGPHEIGTAFLAAYPPRSLITADIKRAKETFRKELHRSGFKGSLVLGGTEAGWSERQGLWILHVHLLGIGVPEEAWGRLRTTLKKSGLRFPLKCQALNDVETQISYLQKFVTYHRPGSYTGSGRSKAIPLPPDRLAELARWWSQYTFDDFLFLFGARRRGGRIVVESDELCVRRRANQSR